MLIISSLFYRFNVIQIKTKAGFLKIRSSQANSKIHREIQGSRTAKIILTKKNKTGILKLSVFSKHYNATLIETV